MAESEPLITVSPPHVVAVEEITRDEHGRATHTPNGHPIRYTVRSKPFFELKRPGQPSLYYCNAHGDYLPKDDFYPASLKPTKQERMCAQHCSARSAGYTRSIKTPWRTAYKYLQDKERTLFNNTELNITIEGMKKLMEIWEMEDIKFVPYANDPYILKVVRWDPSKPCMPWNLVCLRLRNVKTHFRMLLKEGKSLEDVYDEIDIAHQQKRAIIAREEFYQEDLEDDVDLVESDDDDPTDRSLTTHRLRIVRTYKKSKLRRMSENPSEYRSVETFFVKNTGPSIHLPWSLEPITMKVGDKEFTHQFDQVDDDDDESEEEQPMSPATNKKRSKSPLARASKRRRR